MFTVVSLSVVVCVASHLAGRYTNVVIIFKESDSVEIVARKISKGSLFKILLIGTTCSFAVLFIFMGLATLFGEGTLTVFGEETSGIKGLVSVIIFWPVFSVLFTLSMWIYMAFGLWIYSLFKPLKVTFEGMLDK